jgi:TPR repeat protein
MPTSIREATARAISPALLAAGRAAMSDDPEAAARWLTTLAERGDPQGARGLAELYRAQGETEASQRWADRARRWAAAQEEDQAAQTTLDHGDPDEAERLWRRAAEAGYLDAVAVLGQFLARRNAADAEHWLRIGADRGVPRCADLLAQYRAHEQGRTWSVRAIELARGS